MTSSRTTGLGGGARDAREALDPESFPRPSRPGATAETQATSPASLPLLQRESSAPSGILFHFHGPSCGADLPSTENKSADEPCETRKLLDARKPEVQSERNGQNEPSLQKCSHSPLRPRFPTSDPATGSETLTTPPGSAQRRATLAKLRVLGAPWACSEGLSRCRPAAGSDVHV